MQATVIRNVAIQQAPAEMKKLDAIHEIYQIIGPIFESHNLYGDDRDDEQIKWFLDTFMTDFDDQTKHDIGNMIKKDALERLKSRSLRLEVISEKTLLEIKMWEIHSPIYPKEFVTYIEKEGDAGLAKLFIILIGKRYFAYDDRNGYHWDENTCLWIDTNDNVLKGHMVLILPGFIESYYHKNLPLLREAIEEAKRNNKHDFVKLLSKRIIDLERIWKTCPVQTRRAATYVPQ